MIIVTKEVECHYPSESAYHSAEEWYNSNSKDSIIKFCANSGVELRDEESNLRQGWEDIAMCCYAGGLWWDAA